MSEDSDLSETFQVDENDLRKGGVKSQFVVPASPQASNHVCNPPYFRFPTEFKSLSRWNSSFASGRRSTISCNNTFH